MEEKLDKALEYAEATNKIEKLDMTKEELQGIKDAIIDQKSDESFLYNLVKKINESDKENKNGKTKWTV